MRSTCIVLLTVVALMGCATAYQPYTFLGGGGWKEVQLAENTFKVTFEANGYTSASKATDMALLRSSELALSNGFSYFVIGSSSNDSRSGFFQAPSTTTINATTYGNTTRGTATTTGGQLMAFSFPEPTMTIICFTEKPSLQTTIYDARIVSSSIRSQYGIK